MLWSQWFDVTGLDTIGVLLSVAVIYTIILVYTRVFGLRSFSKMSAGDFAMTVAVGSLFGTAVANPQPTVGVAAVAFLGLFLGQFLVAWLRRKSDAAASVLGNAPVLLMSEGQILEENMRRSRVTRADLYAKLREANVLSFEEVRAVVFETTGDVSVLHGEPDRDFDDRLLFDVVEDR